MPIERLDPESAPIALSLQKSFTGQATGAMRDRTAEAHTYSLAKAFPLLRKAGMADRIVAPTAGR